MFTVTENIWNPLEYYFLVNLAHKHNMRREFIRGTMLDSVNLLTGYPPLMSVNGYRFY